VPFEKLRRSPDSIAASPPTLVIYSRRVCHLCDVAKAVAEALQAQVEFVLEVRDVDDRPEWTAAYGSEVPVGFIGDRKVFKYRVDSERLKQALLSGR